MEVRFIAAPMAGLPPTISVPQAKTPMFAIDTSPQAFLADGLQPMMGGGSVVLRRASNQQSNNLSVVQASSSGAIMVNKLE